MSSLTSVFRKTQVDGAIKEEARSFWLPEELLGTIFSFLNYRDLDSCSLVCRQWRKMANDEEVRVTSYLKTRTFGGEQWAAHYGDIGETPSLPPNIRRDLKKPSPFWVGKSVAATTRLLWMPKEINGASFNLDTLSELITHPRKGPATQFRYYDGTIRAEHGTSTKRAGWVLMTNTVIPGSRELQYAKQQALVESHIGYTIPGALEAATYMVTTFVASKEYLYDRTPLTYTRCNEKTEGRCPIVVGGFGPYGLFISSSYFGHKHTGDHERCGVGALLTLCESSRPFYKVSLEV